MAADLSEFMGDETDSHIRSKRLSFAAMAQDNTSSMTSSPISAPIRATPPHAEFTLDRPILENFMSPSSSSSNTPGHSAPRQLGAVDIDIARFAQTPLTRAANHDLTGRNSMANTSFDDLTQRLRDYNFTDRDPPNSNSAPVTPPTNPSFYDPRSRASTLTETSPPLQPIQKDVRMIPYLTPPSEGQSSPANLVLSQSLPVSRRNSNTELMRVGQDLSVIYENAPEAIYPSDHRKSSGTLSGTWSNASAENTYVAPSHGYEETEPRIDNTSSKRVFQMVKTQDGQFPYLSDKASPVPAIPLTRGARHGSVPSWPSVPPPLASRNHATRSSYPEIEARAGPDLDHRVPTERSSTNPSPHSNMLGASPVGHSPARFDINNIAEFVPQGAWSANDDPIPHGNRDGFHSQRIGAFYSESGGSGTYVGNSGYIGSFYADPRAHSLPYDNRQSDHVHENGYAQYTHRDSVPRGNNRPHRRNSSNDERSVLNRTRIQDFAGRIPELCRDQNGCRHLQAQLDKNPEESLDIIFHGAKPYFPDLMSDPFGNYLCQKLFEVCNDAQRTELVRIVAPTLVSISLNQHGTRAVQKLLEHLTVPEQIELVKEALRPDVVLLTKDLNGNHVIQKCLNKLGDKENQFIFDAVAQNCIEVATHKHGCCVFQRCIDHAEGEQSQQLYTELIKNTIALSQDQFGNYVLQYILDRPDTNLSPLIRKFEKHIVQLSKAKFSSNVIEKCVRVANPPDLEFLLTEMVRPGAMAEMIDDPFANYVVQTALDFAEGEQRAMLVREIMPHLSAIKTKTWYKRITIKLGLAPNHSTSHFDSGRHMSSRPYIEEGMHSRMPSEHRGLGPVHGYPSVPHGSDRHMDHRIPPGFMHNPALGGHPSDRNGYRLAASQGISQHMPPPPQQYGNFYPYGPRSALHHADPRSNGEY